MRREATARTSGSNDSEWKNERENEQPEDKQISKFIIEDKYISFIRDWMTEFPM